LRGVKGLIIIIIIIIITNMAVTAGKAPLRSPMFFGHAFVQVGFHRYLTAEGHV
jgi:hypothetical protein